MENYVGMNELVEIIFGKKSTISEQKVAHSSILSSFLTEDFAEKMRHIVLRKAFLICWGYGDFFVGHIQKVLSSHEDYLIYVMSICLREHEENRNLFDSFIGVCAFLQYISETTLVKTGVNFCDLIPDIFMVFYRKVLKTAFLRQKGFYRFLEYIGTHKYLEQNRNAKGRSMFTPAIESRRYRCFQTLLIEKESSRKVTAKSLAQEVLSNTSVELPSLPNKPDLITRLVASRKEEIAIVAEGKRRFESALKKETLHGNSSLNPDANSNCFAKQQEDIARHEAIIQAVIRHNHSKNTNHESANSQISKEANGILDHLKETIESLTEVLDECNEE